MALKIKAREREIKVGKYAGTYRYVMTPELYSKLNQEKVIREAALRSGVSQGVMQACWDAAGEVIKAWATEGHSVALPGLGSMRFGLSAKTVADVNDVKSSLITTRRIVFAPAQELKDELHNTAIQITCYDRNGEIVKRVTSADDGNVESPEDNGDDNGADEGNNGSNGSSENQGGNSGSGSISGNTLAAPTISGNTTFSESSQVSISAADGAEIRYTLDGSTPTASSTLYSEAFTVTETTSVKAIAVKDGQTSEVASKTFVKSSGEGGMDQN